MAILVFRSRAQAHTVEQVSSVYIAERSSYSLLQSALNGEYIFLRGNNGCWVGYSIEVLMQKIFIALYDGE